MNLDIKHLIKAGAKAAKEPGRNPFRDWKKLLVAFFVLDSLVILASLYVLWLVSSESIFEIEGGDEVTVETVDRRQLTKLIKQYEERQTKFDAAATSVPAVVDPSL